MNSVFSDQNRVLQEVRNYYAPANEHMRSESPYAVVYANLGGHDSLLKEICLFILSLLGRQSEKEIEIGKAISAYKIETFDALKAAIFLEEPNTPDSTKLSNIRTACPQFDYLEIHYVYRNLINMPSLISDGLKPGADIKTKCETWQKIEYLVNHEVWFAGLPPALPPQPQCYG